MPELATDGLPRRLYLLGATPAAAALLVRRAARLPADPARRASRRRVTAARARRDRAGRLAAGTLGGPSASWPWCAPTSSPGPGACRPAASTPSCSTYALRRSRPTGPCAGIALPIRRLARCHPWGGSGSTPSSRRKSRLVFDLFATVLGLVLQLHPQLRHRHRPADAVRHGDPDAADAQGHEVDAADAAAAARDQAPAAAVQGRPPEAQRRDDEALPGAQDQPGGRVPAVAPAGAGVHRPLPGADKAHRDHG